MAFSENVHHPTLAEIVDISQVKKHRSGRSSHETRPFVEFTDYKASPPPAAGSGPVPSSRSSDSIDFAPDQKGQAPILER